MTVSQLTQVARRTKKTHAAAEAQATRAGHKEERCVGEGKSAVWDPELLTSKKK